MSSVTGNSVPIKAESTPDAPLPSSPDVEYRTGQAASAALSAKDTDTPQFVELKCYDDIMWARKAAELRRQSRESE